LLEARRDVDGVADDQPLVGSRIAGDYLAGVHTGPVRQPDAPAGLELVVQDREPAPHLGCRPHGPESVVLADPRQPEDGHDRVADVLLDPAAVLLERAADL